MTAFDDVAALTPQQIWHGVVGRSLHGDRATLTVVELEPRSVVPEHSHENEQMGMIVLGSLAFRIGSERRELGPGGTWRILANTPHEVEVGPDGAVVVEVFAPRRDDWASLGPAESRPPRWP